MQGVVYLGESRVEIRDFPQPEPGPGQVVIQSTIAGLCGSDLHKYHSSRPWALEREGMISGHEPTGVVVQCQSERSQHQNRDKAWKQLRAKLHERELHRRREEQQALEDTKDDIGWGSQIRSYVLDQSRVKDLRTELERADPLNVLDGDIDGFLEASLKAGL